MFSLKRYTWNGFFEGWYEDMVRRYNVSDEEELMYLLELKNEAKNLPSMTKFVLVFLSFLGVILLPFFIGLLILVFAFWWQSNIKKNAVERAEQKFLMWRMSRRG